MGIEPTLFAWEAKVLPLNYTRDLGDCTRSVCPFGEHIVRNICRFLAPPVPQFQVCANGSGLFTLAALANLLHDIKNLFGGCQIHRSVGKIGESVEDVNLRRMPVDAFRPAA